MSTGILKVQGDRVVGNDGKPVILRGAGLGGWLNMENFITGYPGHESQHHESMINVLGKEKHDYFFDKFYEYFFTDKDAEFFASKGMNCLRLPFNYRHFEDDMNPRVLKEGGFKHLDRVIDLCAKHKIYTILDLHTVPGAQNPDWHSDNTTNYAAFWDFKDHQDRVCWLWCEIAKRYKDNPWVAGYNPINEPCDPKHYRLPQYYDRIEKEIRKIDSDHILWLDGNTFAMEWKHFEHTLPNCVYALHDYSMMGFPKGEKFTGTPEQKSKLERQFVRKADFMNQHKTPIWNGEFGPVYANPQLEPDHEETNAARYQVLDEQLRIYDKYKIHWSIWLYKDIGVQGMVYVNPDSKWMKTIAPFLKKSRALQLNAWGRYPSKQAEEVIEPLVAWIDKNAPTSKDQYPTPWVTERQITRLINQCWLSGCLSDEFAEQFRGMSMEDLEECAKSFHFDQCMQRDGLNKALMAHSEVPDLEEGWTRPTDMDGSYDKNEKFEQD
ncbi:glycoside hydrolase family 5 protein [Baudoinia panamericana UAMH 10762]|uniref:Glycoside hydrolase family 5 protein n=1 Tax=Baudoinia panamericana (strain UAMH 10762) TaxID=717646 RepID=M2LQ83_BAUPA|nr:glycoside hydrolase family 5 protein [Baudoinia panamericana UAMH 10762]EMC96562.1 glycoside hydrolase family 5 protein [Baudoinia panamericana UAMH 10762]